MSAAENARQAGSAASYTINSPPNWLGFECSSPGVWEHAPVAMLMAIPDETDHMPALPVIAWLRTGAFQTVWWEIFGIFWKLITNLLRNPSGQEKHGFLKDGLPTNTNFPQLCNASGQPMMGILACPPVGDMFNSPGW